MDKIYSSEELARLSQTINKRLPTTPMKGGLLADYIDILDTPTYFDGIHRRYSLYNGPEHDEWLVYKPNQIKSVFATNFDSTSDDIIKENYINRLKLLAGVTI